MPTLKLQARALAALAVPKAGRVDYFDGITPGLHLRVSASGARSWAFSYKPRGSRVPKRVTLGPLADLTLADARDRARDLRATVMANGDPRAEEKAAHRLRTDEARRARTDTFELLAQRVLGAFGHKLDERSTRPEWERKLRVDVFPALGKMRPSEIAREDVAALIQRKAQTAPYAALRVFEVVRWVFTRAAERGWVPASPCVGLKASDFFEERVREKVFTDAELRTLLAYAESESGVKERLRFVVPLVAYTGVRLDEALGAEWSDFDLERDLWTIPAAKTKSEEAHEVPLSRQALTVLKGIRESQPEAVRWLFPARMGDAYMVDPHYPADLKAELGYTKGARAMVCHDLRRTVATRLAQSGTPLEVVDAILGHKPPKLIRAYVKHAYLPETRTALKRWGEDLERIARGEKEKAGRKVTRGRFGRQSGMAG